MLALSMRFRFTKKRIPTGEASGVLNYMNPREASLANMPQRRLFHQATTSRAARWKGQI
ncbi:MAG: hypothetical protein HOI15_03665 [Opitutales bacterium]|nr:hypothetical protein [Opitutales bacterium]MBT5813439.1 hypothetical protein [Opitutales bacterium]